MFRATALVLALSSAIASQEVVLDFEGVPTGTFELITETEPYLQDGFQIELISMSGDLAKVIYGPGQGTEGSLVLFGRGLPGTRVRLSRVDGGRFNLYSLDVTGADPRFPPNVKLLTSDRASFQIPDRLDSIRTWEFDNLWEQIRFVEFEVGHDRQDPGNYHAALGLDNIVVQPFSPSVVLDFDAASESGASLPWAEDGYVLAVDGPAASSSITGLTSSPCLAAIAVLSSSNPVHRVRLERVDGEPFNAGSVEAVDVVGSQDLASFLIKSSRGGVLDFSHLATASSWPSTQPPIGAFDFMGPAWRDVSYVDVVLEFVGPENGIAISVLALDNFVVARANPEVCVDADHYGAGTPGTEGILPTIEIPRLPQIPDSEFSIEASDLLGNVATAVVFGFQELDFPFLGITVLADPVRNALKFASGSGAGNGFASFPIPIPDNPGLIGMDVFAQIVTFDPGSEFGLAASNGVRFRLCDTLPSTPASDR